MTPALQMPVMPTSLLDRERMKEMRADSRSRPNDRARGVECLASSVSWLLADSRVERYDLLHKV